MELDRGSGTKRSCWVMLIALLLLPFVAVSFWTRSEKSDVSVLVTLLTLQLSIPYCWGKMIWVGKLSVLHVWRWRVKTERGALAPGGDLRV